MSEHTPGPWEVYGSEGVWSVGPKGITDMDDVVAFVNIANPNQEQDARLIARAPEMQAEIHLLKEHIKKRDEQDFHKQAEIDRLQGLLSSGEDIVEFLMRYVTHIGWNETEVRQWLTNVRAALEEPHD